MNNNDNNNISSIDWDDDKQQSLLNKSVQTNSDNKPTQPKTVQPTNQNLKPSKPDNSGNNDFIVQDNNKPSKFNKIVPIILLIFIIGLVIVFLKTREDAKEAEIKDQTSYDNLAKSYNETYHEYLDAFDRQLTTNQTKDIISNLRDKADSNGYIKGDNLLKEMFKKGAVKVTDTDVDEILNQLRFNARTVDTGLTLDIPTDNGLGIYFPCSSKTLDSKKIDSYRAALKSYLNENLKTLNDEEYEKNQKISKVKGFFGLD